MVVLRSIGNPQICSAKQHKSRQEEEMEYDRIRQNHRREEMETVTNRRRFLQFAVALGLGLMCSLAVGLRCGTVQARSCHAAHGMEQLEPLCRQD